MNSRIPLILQPLLSEFLQRLNEKMPGFLTAFYLVGSIALEDFHPGQSDVDFIGVLSRPPTGADVDSLAAIHQAVGQAYPKWKLEGMYFQAEAVGRAERTVPPYLNYHDGALKFRTEAHLTIISWWVLKNHGIPLLGPHPRELPFTVDWNTLSAQMKENLNTYWKSWAYRPVRLMSLTTDYCVQWTVLGVLRQYYSFRERSITTKTKAGEYALGCLPQTWRPIIRESIRLRDDPDSPSLYRSKLGRAFTAARFLRYILRECNALQAGASPPDR